MTIDMPESRVEVVVAGGIVGTAVEWRVVMSRPWRMVVEVDMG
jgi:hypothetical protein